MDEHKSESNSNAKIESTQKKVEFNEIIEIKLGEIEGQIKFILENGKIITENIESCLKFVDPSYDSVFKAIFEDEIPLEGIDGNQRLLNLLNSLIFPNEEFKCFTEVKYISEENKISEKKFNSVMRFDISCIAKVLDKKKNTTKTIDIEIQFGKKIDGMHKYIKSLYQTYNMETILIAFMNHEIINDENRSQFSIKTVCDGKGKIIKEVHDVEVIIVNLKEEIENNKCRKKIYINKKELNSLGISWLKLLGIRQWGKTINNFYYLPKNIQFLSKELKSTFQLLQNYDERELIGLLRKEEEDNNILKLYEEKGEKKGKIKHILGSLFNLFENKKESFDEMINIIDYEHNEFKKESFDDMIDIIDFEKSSFKIKDIEEIIPERNKRNEFIRLLGKKRKIE